ncbi:MAG: copper-binding protein [Blastocatellia bacterium]|nr:copper-binding protein [Blastocatellia bacterium]
MKIKLLSVAALASAAVASCGSPHAVNDSVPKAGTAISSAPSPSTPVPTPVVPADGDYDAKGVVTKIDLNLGSLEIDHEEIKGVMPPMKMEFFVSDKKILDGVSVGDKIDFVLRHKTPTETIVKITKAK